uniref:Uncharacterized protein n=1 Tax=Glossina morsitans morsitans TaxID=37546 RepID=A0A1B0FLV0_GLOMM
MLTIAFRIVKVLVQTAAAAVVVNEILKWSFHNSVLAQSSSMRCCDRW